LELSGLYKQYYGENFTNEMKNFWD